MGNNPNPKNENINQVIKPNSAPKRKSKLAKIILYTVIGIILSALLVGLGLLWQLRFDFLGITNAFYLSGSLLFAFGLIVYAANRDAFASLVYGTKSFFSIMFAGRRPKLTYYDYLQDQKNHRFPSILVFLPLIYGTPNLIVAIILHIIYNTYIYQPL